MPFLCLKIKFSFFDVELQRQLQLQVSTSTSTPTAEMVCVDLIDLNVLYKSVSGTLCSIPHSSGDINFLKRAGRGGSTAGPAPVYNDKLKLFGQFNNGEM